MSYWKDEVNSRLNNLVTSDTFKDQQIRELYERIAKLEKPSTISYLDRKVVVLEDAIMRIARTLDANGIKEACSSCGQKLPVEKDCC